MSLPFPGYRHVLVAIDFSPPAEAALKQAAWLARKADASLTLAHVLPESHRAAQYQASLAPSNLANGEDESFEQKSRQDADARMRRMIQRLNAMDIDARFVTFVGRPFVKLTHAVQQEGYDLVLAGARGLAAWEQFLVGGTSSRLIRKCPAAVWIARPEQVGPPRAVLAATDFSDVSLQAVKQGIWVARQAGAEFHLLHVVDSMDVPEDVISKIPQGSTLRNEINAEATKRLEDFVASLRNDGEPSPLPKIHLSWGTPWKEVVRLAKHVAADLIAMGTVGRSGIRGVLLGNTAEKVLAACDCSILTVKPDGYVSPIEPAP